MNNETIIIRRPTTDEENEIGIRLSKISLEMIRLLRDLSREYAGKDPTRFMALYTLNQTFLDAEADFFGFNSWGDLQKWRNIHGGILNEIET